MLQNHQKNEAKINTVFLLDFFDFLMISGVILESIFMNFRVVAKNGRHAFRLRRRDRIEVRTFPNQAKNEPEGSQNLGFDSRSFFLDFEHLLAQFWRPKWRKNVMKIGVEIELDKKMEKSAKK